MTVWGWFLGPCARYFSPDAGIVTTRLGRLQWTSFRNFLFRTVFWRNPWVLAFGFCPENGGLGLILGSLCSLFFADMLVLWLLDSADCNEPVSGTFYSGQFLDEIRRVLAFSFGPENGCFGLILGSLCSLFFVEMLVLWLLDSADCNEPVSETFYFG